MKIDAIENDIVSEFSLFEDWMDKYNYLIELGKSLQPVEDDLKLDKFLISGCQSRVWLIPSFNEGKVVFRADSDALITKGIVALLIRVLSGHAPKEIIEAELSFIDNIGLKEHLSQTRSNGLLSMVRQMKLYALAYQAGSTKEINS